MELTFSTLYFSKKKRLEKESRSVRLSSDKLFFEVFIKKGSKEHWLFKEEFDGPFTRWLNGTSSVKQRTPFLVTKYIDPQISEDTYTIYFQSREFPDTILCFSMTFKEHRKRFFHEKLLGRCLKTDTHQTWESVDYKFCDEVFWVAEEFLLNQPQYRLRFVTGEIKKRDS